MKTIISFNFFNVSIKMENNRFRDVTVDHFIRKKETMCCISIVWDTEVMKLITHSVRHIGSAITRIFMVVMATKLGKNKFDLK